MITDAVASSVTVSASWWQNRFLMLVANITRTDGTTAILPFAWAWDSSGNAIALPSTTGQSQLDFGDPNNAVLLRIL